MCGWRGSEWFPVSLLHPVWGFPTALLSPFQPIFRLKRPHLFGCFSLKNPRVPPGPTPSSNITCRCRGVPVLCVCVNPSGFSTSYPIFCSWAVPAVPARPRNLFPATQPPPPSQPASLKPFSSPTLTFQVGAAAHADQEHEFCPDFHPLMCPGEEQQRVLGSLSHTKALSLLGAAVLDLWRCHIWFRGGTCPGDTGRRRETSLEVQSSPAKQSLSSCNGEQLWLPAERIILIHKPSPITVETQLLGKHLFKGLKRSSRG